MSSREEERLLVDGCRRGDEEAWRALYRSYAADCGTFLRGMLRDPTEVDDLVQRVFLEFLSTLDRFRGDASLRTWLHRIARHVALQDIRSQRRRRDHVKAYAEAVAGEDARSPEGRSIARDRLDHIQGILAEMRAVYREVWILREVQGFSVEETALILSTRAATVRTRHHRARRQLLAALEAADPPDGHGTTTRRGLTVVDGGDA